MGVIQVQTDFTHGELSPLMRGRYDTRLYSKACERLTNMLVLPQGAATRRFGIDFLKEINASVNEYQLFNFSSVEGDNFLLMLVDSFLRIFNEDGSEHPSSPLPFPFSGSQLITSQVRYAQTHDEALFVHPDVQPLALRFNPTTNTFSTVNFAFKNAPTFDFQDVDYSNVIFTLENIRVGEGGVLDTNSPVFDSEHVGGLFISSGENAASPVGVARLVRLNSSTSMEVEIISTFSAGGGEPVENRFIGKNSILEKVAISETRKWPRSVTFYENRLIFGGTKSLPQTIFMSQIADYTDFSVGTARDSDAIVVTISSNKSTQINYLISDRSLQIFTSSGEFTPPQLTENALTPTTFSIRKQSSIGASIQVEPVVIDNNTLYIQKGGRSVLAFVYDDNTASYQSIESSTVSNHLIANVIDMTTLKGRVNSDANFVFLVNADVVERIDETLPAGSLTSFQTISAQNIQAWTPIITKNGKFKRVQAVGDSLFFLIEREVNGTKLQYLEKANFGSLTDSSLNVIFESPTTIVEGLEHLNGETVDVIADGFVLSPRVVINGEIIVENEASVFEIGLNILTEIRTMPISVESQEGVLLPLPKRIPRLFIDLLKSQGVEVDGVLIRNLLFSEEFIDGPLPLVSGLFEITNLGGWNRRQTISLTQCGPFKMTVLGIGYEVEI